MVHHLVKSQEPHVRALGVQVMEKILNATARARNLNKLKQCTVPFVNCIIDITSVSNAAKRLTIWQILILNGAMIVWINGASVLVAMDILNLTCRHSAMLSGSLRIRLFVFNVVRLGNVLFANQRSVPRYDGLLVKTCVLNVRNYLSVAVLVDLCVNILLANVLSG